MCTKFGRIIARLTVLCQHIETGSWIIEIHFFLIICCLLSRTWKLQIFVEQRRASDKAVLEDDEERALIAKHIHRLQVTSCI